MAILKPRFFVMLLVKIRVWQLKALIFGALMGAVLAMMLSMGE
jgi:hypothetical protein